MSKEQATGGFAEEFTDACVDVHEAAKAQWGLRSTEIDQKLMMVGLVTSELGEFVQALRNHDPESTACPGHKQGAEEVIDIVILAMNLLAYMDADPGRLLMEKIAYNKTRTWRHGGKAF